jgi:hypothetical protein
MCISYSARVFLPRHSNGIYAAASLRLAGENGSNFSCTVPARRAIALGGTFGNSRVYISSGCKIGIGSEGNAEKPAAAEQPRITRNGSLQTGWPAPNQRFPMQGFLEPVQNFPCRLEKSPEIGIFGLLTAKIHNLSRLLEP